MPPPRLDDEGEGRVPEVPGADDEQEVALDPDVFNNFYVNLLRLKGHDWDPCCGSLMDVLRGSWVVLVHCIVFVLSIYLMTNVDSKGMMGMRCGKCALLAVATLWHAVCAAMHAQRML